MRLHDFILFDPGVASVVFGTFVSQRFYRNCKIFRKHMLSVKMKKKIFQKHLIIVLNGNDCKNSSHFEQKNLKKIKQLVKSNGIE